MMLPNILINTITTQNIFLHDFSNLFVLLIGINLGYVIVIKGSNMNGLFFFDYLNDKSNIENLSLYFKDQTYKLKRYTRDHTVVTIAELFKLNEILDDKQKIIFESIIGLQKAISEIIDKKIKYIESLSEIYSNKLPHKKPTPLLHLPIICGAICAYGIFVLIIAAINDINVKYISFLFWSDFIIVIYLIVCMITEGELEDELDGVKKYKFKLRQFKEEEGEGEVEFEEFEGKQKIHKKYDIFDNLFHPRSWNFLLVVFLLFGIFVVILNDWVEFYYPYYITEHIIVYITITVFFISFIGYLFWDFANKIIHYVPKKLFEILFILKLTINIIKIKNHIKFRDREIDQYFTKLNLEEIKNLIKIREIEKDDFKVKLN